MTTPTDKQGDEIDRPRAEGELLREAAELLPCPFCGEQAEAYETEPKGSTLTTHTVGCLRWKCGASVGYFDRQVDAVEAWNRRTTGASNGN